MNKLIENFILLDRISATEFSEVYKCRHKLTNENFAIKMISFEKFANNPKFQEQLSNELHALKQLENAPHIVKFVKLLKTKNNVYLVYEFCEGGSLQDLEEKTRIFAESEALDVLNQLVEGLSIIHSNKIVHGDLKPSNLLFKGKELKIVDFGFCRFTNEKKKTDLSKYFIGSPIYMAPELFENSEMSEKSDIYAIGVIFYEMLFGKAPIEGNDLDDLIEKVRNTFALSIPREINNIGQDSEKILRVLLERDPAKRPSVFEVRELLMKKAKGSNDLKEIKEMEIKMNFKEYFEDRNTNYDMDAGNKLDLINNIETFATFKREDAMKMAGYAQKTGDFMKKLSNYKKGLLFMVQLIKTTIELNLHESNVLFIWNLLKKIKGEYIDLIIILQNQNNLKLFFAEIMKVQPESLENAFLDHLIVDEGLQAFVNGLILEERRCEETLNSYKTTLKYSFELTDFLVFNEINDDLFDFQAFRRSGGNYLKQLKEIASYFYLNCKNETLLKEMLVHGVLCFEIFQDLRNLIGMEEKYTEVSGMTIVILFKLFEEKFDKFIKSEGLKV